MLHVTVISKTRWIEYLHLSTKSTVRTARLHRASVVSSGASQQPMAQALAGTAEPPRSASRTAQTSVPIAARGNGSTVKPTRPPPSLLIKARPLSLFFLFLLLCNRSSGEAEAIKKPVDAVLFPPPSQCAKTGHRNLLSTESLWGKKNEWHK